MIKKIIKLLLIVLLITTACYAQNDKVNARREQEHAAVKQLLDQMMARRNSKNNVSANKSAGQDVVKKYSNNTSRLRKTFGADDRKSVVMNGNSITVEIYNYGGISPGGEDIIRHSTNFVWKDLSYVYTFGPIIGAKVFEKGKTERTAIFSDGLNDYTNYSELNPANSNERWQWQPLSGYADPDSDEMAHNPDNEDKDGDGKPDSWPRSWYSESLDQYVWPGMLSQDATNADVEAFWAMDDRENKEFNYYPFPDDTTRKGLGLQVDGRAFQWSNSLASNAVFLVYTITNVSPEPLDSVVFGIYGDPDLGGGSPENTDDSGFFVPPTSNDSVDVTNIPVYARSLVYLWDEDMAGDYGYPLGYLGCKFLESPGKPNDGEDNDGDGMIDESQTDNLDNDNDWNPLTDDVGIDGVKDTGDEGEGNGKPDAGLAQADGSPHPLYPGEPNFEYTDKDESDQVGLTSFNSWRWSADAVANDLSMWNRMIPDNYGDITNDQDIVFVFGSGYISLDPGETKRISMALLCGEDLDDLLTTAETVQRIYNSQYQFFKPPELPTLTAVPGDKKVTLYWDAVSEESVDPISGKDFEGYVIYRSTDPSFDDIKVITDGQGSDFLSEPLKDIDGNEAKWDVATISEPFVDENNNGVYDNREDYTDVDLSGDYTSNMEDPWKGYHPVQYNGRGLHYYLGNNTGLVHSFVDSNNVINGQTYYYAVVAYDHGDSTYTPVTETTKQITEDPITFELTFAKNTAKAIPGPRAAGYIASSANQSQDIDHVSGFATGKVGYNIVSDLNMVDDEYILTFSDSIVVNNEIEPLKTYSILKSNVVSQSFLLYDYKNTVLNHAHLSNDDNFTVKDSDGNIYTKDEDFTIDFKSGTIKRLEGTSMENGGRFEVTYKHYPVFESTLLNDEDANVVFDGIRVHVLDFEEVTWDTLNSGWSEGNSNFLYSARLNTSGLPNKYKAPIDCTVEFFSEMIDTAILTDGKKYPVQYTVSDVTTGIPIKLLTFLFKSGTNREKYWESGDQIVLFAPGSQGLVTDTTTWGITITAPKDSLLTPIPPTEGDILYVKTKKPFTPKDKFILKTQASTWTAENAKSKLDNIYVVPNPYVGYNIIEPTTSLVENTRGGRRIYFENLPPECTIRIYTLSGDPVTKIEHLSSVENGREYWNLLSEDGFSVAYGVYIAHINAPGIGERILKFALIK